MTFPYTQRNVSMPTVHQDTEGSLQHGSLKALLKQGLLIIKEMDATVNIIVLGISKPGWERDRWPQQTRRKPLMLIFPYRNHAIPVSFIRLVPSTATIVFSSFTQAKAKENLC